MPWPKCRCHLASCSAAKPGGATLPCSGHTWTFATVKTVSMRSRPFLASSPPSQKNSREPCCRCVSSLRVPRRSCVAWQYEKSQGFLVHTNGSSLVAASGLPGRSTRCRSRVPLPSHDQHRHLHRTERQLHRHGSHPGESSEVSGQEDLLWFMFTPCTAICRAGMAPLSGGGVDVNDAPPTRANGRLRVAALVWVQCDPKDDESKADAPATAREYLSPARCDAIRPTLGGSVPSSKQGYPAGDRAPSDGRSLSPQLDSLTS